MSDDASDETVAAPPSRLSAFAQDALLMVIYELDEIPANELTTSELNILSTARRYDNEECL